MWPASKSTEGVPVPSGVRQPWARDPAIVEPKTASPWTWPVSGVSSLGYRRRRTWWLRSAWSRTWRWVPTVVYKAGDDYSMVTVISIAQAALGE